MDQTNKKPNLFSLGILSAFFIMLFLSVAFTSSNKIKTRNTKAAMGPTTVNLVMNGAELKDPSGYLISVAITKASNTIPIGTARISFSYPKDIFDVSGIRFTTPFSQSAAGGTGTDVDKGEVTVVADWPRDATSGNLLDQSAGNSMMVAQIAFQVKTGKTASGTFKFTSAEIIGDSSGMPTNITVENHDPYIVGTSGGGADATPTVTGTPDVITPTLSVGNTTINLKLKFQGVVKKPAINIMRIRVAVMQGTNRYNGTGDFTSDDNGVWSGSAKVEMPSTSTTTGWSILVKGPKHMQKKICDTSPTESYAGTYGCGQGNITMTPAGANTFDFTKLTMLVGDLPEQDGIINSYDFSLIRNNLNTKDAKIISIADVNYDGKVDSQDASLVLAALSVRQDEQ